MALLDVNKEPNAVTNGLNAQNCLVILDLPVKHPEATSNRLRVPGERRHTDNPTPRSSTSLRKPGDVGSHAALPRHSIFLVTLHLTGQVSFIEYET